MRSQTLFGLAICLIVPMSVGCGNQQGLIRGQSPAGDFGGGVTPAGGFYDAQAAGGVEQVAFHVGGAPGCGPVGVTSSLSEKFGCSSCRKPGCNTGSCDSGCNTSGCGAPGTCGGACGDPGCCLGLNHQKYPGAWYPTHHHHFEYDPPKNLVYPPSNVPPAMIVYPYYTCKGPDDFFKAY